MIILIWSYSYDHIDTIILIWSHWYDHIDMITLIWSNWYDHIYLYKLNKSADPTSVLNYSSESQQVPSVIIWYRYDQIPMNGLVPLTVKWQMTQPFTWWLLYTTVIWVNLSYWYEYIDTHIISLIQCTITWWSCLIDLDWFEIHNSYSLRHIIAYDIQAK